MALLGTYFRYPFNRSMKIGILTYHRSYNFGANLQALAVQSILRAKGHDTVFVNYQDPKKIKEYRKSVPPQQVAEHESFFDRYFFESPILHNSQEVMEYCIDSLDCLIVGSDAVFRLTPKYDPIIIAKKLLGRKLSPEQIDPENISPYWLNWQHSEGKKIIKASLAASSMGTNYHFISSKTIDRLRKSLESFDFISVRDEWTKKMVAYITHGTISPIICPDPVFSLHSFFSIPEYEFPELDVSKTILISGNFSEKWLRLFVQAAHEAGYQVAGLPNPDNPFTYELTDYNIPLPLSPLTWFILLGNSAGYIGIRFHALVACITQRTPVINVDSHPRSRFIKSGSKMYDLCKRAGLKHQYYTLHKILRTDPTLVLQRLFDQQGMIEAQRYAASAQSKFVTIIDYITNME